MWLLPAGLRDGCDLRPQRKPKSDQGGRAVADHEHMPVRHVRRDPDCYRPCARQSRTCCRRTKETGEFAMKAAEGPSPGARIARRSFLIAAGVINGGRLCGEEAPGTHF